MNRPCVKALCRICRPGHLCEATRRWIAEEDYEEEKARVADEARERLWAERSRMPRQYAPMRKDWFGEWHEVDLMEEDRYG